MRWRAALAGALALRPGVAWACASCIASAYGDRAFNWAYVGLILMPFVLAALIGGVLAGCYLRPRYAGRYRELLVRLAARRAHGSSLGSHAFSGHLTARLAALMPAAIRPRLGSHNPRSRRRHE